MSSVFKQEKQEERGTQGHHGWQKQRMGYLQLQAKEHQWLRATSQSQEGIRLQPMHFQRGKSSADTLIMGLSSPKLGDNQFWLF